jgi:hypothetical protein
MAMINAAKYKDTFQFSASIHNVWRNVQGIYSLLNDRRLATIHSGLLLQSQLCNFLLDVTFYSEISGSVFRMLN